MTATNTISRNSSIEALRIISMIMIVICHYHFMGKHCGSLTPMEDSLFSRIVMFLKCQCGVVADNIFVLISGYFLVESKEISIKRILKLWEQILFYSIVIYCISSLLSLGDGLSLKTTIAYFLPITSNKYWFASTYLVLYVIHPFLNIIINHINKKNYLILLLFAISMWCIIPSITIHRFESNPLIWFITLYFISGYIKKYGLSTGLNFKMYIIISVLLYIASAIFFATAGKYIFAFNSDPVFYVQHILILAPALCTFIAFVNLKPRNNRIINIIASATFGVYLIHMHPCIYIPIWKCLSNMSGTIAIVTVYVGCTIIELLRQFTIEKPFLRMIDKLNIKPIIIE